MKNKFQIGTTIVELTLYMGLLSIFLFILSDLFVQMLNTQTRSTAVSLVQNNGNFLLTKLTRDINQADTITTPSSLGTSSTTIVLTMGTTSATYSIGNSRLQRTDSSGTYYLNDADTSISNFNALRLGNTGGKHGLQFSFTVTSNVVDNSNIKSAIFQSAANLR